MSWILLIPGISLMFYGLYLLHKAWFFTLLLKESSGKKKSKGEISGNNRSVSVIIPARNEANNIENRLKSLILQDFTSDSLEIIVVDDASEDATFDLATAFAQKFAEKSSSPKIKVVKLPDISTLPNNPAAFIAFKKAALTFGIGKSSGEIIVTTDADCTAGPGWLGAIISSFSPGVKMVSGPVSLTGNSIFARFQALESMGLIAVGAASIREGRPTMCNGANLAYTRAAFEEVKGFEGIDHIASGDDELLMHKISQTASGCVRFAADPAAIVSTSAAQTWSEFKNQRIRWVSKSRHYSRSSISWVLVSAYVGMLIFPILGLMALAGWETLPILLGAFCWKIFTESVILYFAALFFNKLQLLVWLPVEQIFHILYVLWVGIAGNLLKYEWKGRNVH